MKIAVIGTWYVGLVTWTCLAETGNYVTCIDIDEHKVQSMKDGIIPIYEPHLDVLFQRNIAQKRLQFTTDLTEWIAWARVLFLALPTPPGEDGSADLSYIMGVADKLGPLLSEYTIVIDKSTVPVGTSDKVRECIARNCQVEFDVVSNPEFLREWFAVDDFMKPDRIVIGTDTDKPHDTLLELYKPYVRQWNPIIFMDTKSAELTKYAANSFLAMKISFMNEMANYCEKVVANIDDVRRGIGSDERIGKRFLFPGIGYGGSCFPKDVKALIKSGKDIGYNFTILSAVESVNDTQKHILIDKIEKHFAWPIHDKTIAIRWLAFKPDTDDIREAASLVMINTLLIGNTIKVYDPVAMPNVQKIYGDTLTYGSSEYDILEHADILIVATEWPVFRNPDLDLIKSSMKTPIIFDGRNIFDPQQMYDHGFIYYGIGR